MKRLRADLKILIVDDSSETITIAKLYLQNKDLLNTSSCTDVDTALSMLERAKKEGEPFQICFIDWNIPKKPGIELVKAVNANPDLIDLKMVMMTADSEESHVKEAIRNGIKNYILKPLTADKLFQKVIETVKKS